MSSTLTLTRRVRWQRARRVFVEQQGAGVVWRHLCLGGAGG